jgi:glutamine amidotransferase
MTSKVTILDYGMCNLLNVARAFQVLGADVTVTEDAATAAAAERLVVPGVGAFEDSVNEVRARGFDNVIRAYVDTGRPFLGICVGMQMLFDASEEFGEHPGLGLLGGRVQGVPALTVEGAPQRVPHIGWNHLVEPEAGRLWMGTFLDSCVDDSPGVYFVHSFAAVPEFESDRLADCIYGGHRICAAVQRDNLMAVQFHPERSARQGLGMLQGFMQL